MDKPPDERAWHVQVRSNGVSSLDVLSFDRYAFKVIGCTAAINSHAWLWPNRAFSAVRRGPGLFTLVPVQMCGLDCFLVQMVGLHFCSQSTKVKMYYPMYCLIFPACSSRGFPRKSSYSGRPMLGWPSPGRVDGQINSVDTDPLVSRGLKCGRSGRRSHASFHETMYFVVSHLGQAWEL